MRAYYEQGGIKIYHGDYREVLPAINAKFDLLCADPPYATTNLVWDKPVDWKFFWREADRLCKPTAPSVLFSSGKFTIELINSNPKNYRYELIWEKPMPTGFLDAKRRPLRAHENILVFARKFKGSAYNPQMVVGRMHMRGNAGSRAAHYKTTRLTAASVSNEYYPRSILRFQNARGSKSLHPTQKPLALVTWLLRTYSHRGDLVLDPFIGSGTTLEAAQALGRRAVGIELDERYCEIAANRLRKARAA